MQMRGYVFQQRSPDQHTFTVDLMHRIILFHQQFYVSVRTNFGFVQPSNYRVNDYHFVYITGWFTVPHFGDVAVLFILLRCQL
jgi:hypothetical protein